jgi:excisionase family DNA binding protein
MNILSNSPVNVKTPPVPRLLLTMDQAGESIGLCGKSIYSLIRKGSLRCIRIGKAVRVSPSDLADFIDRQRAASTSTVGPVEGVNP